MTKTRVAVLRGGPSAEYDVSMQSGAGVIAMLQELNYDVIDVIISKQGEWLLSGKVKNPDRALLAVDVVFIAMHGAYGEDGTVQRICERLHIPFTGSNSFASSLAFNKDVTKRALNDVGINLPKHIKLGQEHRSSLYEMAQVIERSFGPQYVIKPLTSGSSHGVVMVADSAQLVEKLENSLSAYEECMIEERIIGVEATCGVLAHYRNNELYALPPVEIVPPPDKEFFDYEVKYNGQTLEICPGRFSFAEKQKIIDLATLVHKELRLNQYSRTDCIVRDGEVYFLEVNTLPGLTSQSLFPKAAEAVGLSFKQLIDHLVKTAEV